MVNSYCMPADHSGTDMERDCNHSRNSQMSSAQHMHINASLSLLHNDKRCNNARLTNTFSKLPVIDCLQSAGSTAQPNSQLVENVDQFSWGLVQWRTWLNALIVQNSNFRHLFVNPFCAKLCGQRTRFILCLTIRLLSRKCGIKLSVNDSVLSIPHFAPIYWLQHLGDPMNDDIMLGLVQLIGTGTVHLKLVTNHS